MKKIGLIYQNFLVKLAKIEKEKYCYFEFANDIQKLYTEFVVFFIEYEKNNEFKSKKNEQLYFCEIKANFIAQFIYARKILEIQSTLVLHEKAIDVLKTEHEKILLFKRKNYEQISNLNSLINSTSNIQYSIGVFDDLIFRELSNTLSIDLLLAFIKANEKIELYLFEIEQKVKKQNSAVFIPLEDVFSKTEICELAYAIHELKGKKAITVKELSLRLCAVFGVESFNPYDLLREISKRNSNQTKLLKSLEISLLNKIRSLYN